MLHQLAPLLQEQGCLPQGSVDGYKLVLFGNVPEMPKKFYLLGPDRRVPLLVGKIARNEEHVRRLKHERDIMGELEPVLGRMLPRAVYYGQAGPYRVLLQEYVDGVPLDKPLSRPLSDRRARKVFGRCLQRGLTCFTDFGRAQDGGTGGRIPETLITHGDLRLEHIMERPDGTLVIIDWEWAARDRSPIWDLHLLLLHALWRLPELLRAPAGPHRSLPGGKAFQWAYVLIGESYQNFARRAGRTADDLRESLLEVVTAEAERRGRYWPPGNFAEVQRLMETDRQAFDHFLGIDL